MRFVTDDKLVPGQTYMIYYPKPDTHSNYGSQYLVGIFTGRSLEGALIFNVNGSFVSNLPYEDDDNLNPHEEYSPVDGTPTLEQLAYGRITMESLAKDDKKEIKRRSTTFGGKRCTRRKSERRGPTRA